MEHGFKPEQLYSTASYKLKNLQGIEFWRDNLTGWDFSGQDLARARFVLLVDPTSDVANLTGDEFSGANLTGADLAYCELAGANMAGAVVRGASFHGTTSRGLTKEQLYATASYQNKDLRGIWLAGNDLSGWDFSEQNLSNATVSTLTDVDLRGANLANAFLTGTAVVNSATTYNQWTDLPGINPGASGPTFIESRAGDFNADEDLDVADIDVLVSNLNVAFPVNFRVDNEALDLNSDGIVDLEDHRTWVKDLKNTWFGDADLDGEFRSNDIVKCLSRATIREGRHTSLLAV